MKYGTMLCAPGRNTTKVFLYLSFLLIKHWQMMRSCVMHARAECVLLWDQVCKLTQELSLEEVKVNSPTKALVSKLEIKESKHALRGSERLLVGEIPE